MMTMEVKQRKAPVTWERILYFIFGLFLLGCFLLAVSGCAINTRIELDEFSFYAKRIGSDE